MTEENTAAATTAEPEVPQGTDTNQSADAGSHVEQPKYPQSMSEAEGMNSDKLLGFAGDQLNQARALLSIVAKRVQPNTPEANAMRLAMDGLDTGDLFLGKTQFIMREKEKYLAQQMANQSLHAPKSKK